MLELTLQQQQGYLCYGFNFNNLIKSGCHRKGFRGPLALPMFFSIEAPISVFSSEKGPCSYLANLGFYTGFKGLLLRNSKCHIHTQALVLCQTVNAPQVLLAGWPMG